MYNRREFVKTLSCSAAGAAFLSNLFYWKPLNAETGEIGFHNRLTTFAVLDDIVTLVMRSQLVPLPLIGDLHANFNLSIPGNFSRMGWLAPVISEEQALDILALEKARAIELWNNMTKAEQDNPESEPMQQRLKALSKVALMMGWIMSVGVRDILQPVWSSFTDSVEEMAAYQDMYTLKQIAGISIPGPVDDIESLFLEMVPRMITRTHTLTPDYDDGPDWTVRISEWRYETATQLNLLAQVYSLPDSEKTAEYIENINFYDPEEEIITAARDGGRLEWPLNETPLSLYGKALAKGIESIVRVGDHLYPTHIFQENKSIPDTFKLYDNFPNPFNPTTTINYELQITNYVELSIYNILGQKVAVLVSERQAAGRYQVSWDASGFASGVYYYTLSTSSGFVQSNKMVLLK